jgi:hypothetical protein
MKLLRGALAVILSIAVVMPAFAGEDDDSQNRINQENMRQQQQRGRVNSVPPPPVYRAPPPTVYREPAPVYRAPQPVYRRDYDEPRYRPGYRSERRSTGYGVECVAVRNTFCRLYRPQPIGSACNCPKGGGVREGYVER